MPTGYIYELKCKDLTITNTYIGSTYDMEHRIKEHKSYCYNTKIKKYNYSVYKFIRNNGGFDNWIMEMIIMGDCEDETELRCAEQFYIDMSGGIENLLNDKDALQDKEQRIEKNNKSKNIIIKKNIETKKYYCVTCNHAFTSKRDLQRHYTTKIHKHKTTI